MRGEELVVRWVVGMEEWGSFGVWLGGWFFWVGWKVGN